VLAITTGEILVESGVTATVDANLELGHGLVKTGDGTLVIGAAAGDTSVTTGTLLLASSGSLQSTTVGTGGTVILHGIIQGDLFNDGTIVAAGDLNSDGLLAIARIDLLFTRLAATADRVGHRSILTAGATLDEQARET